MKKVLVCGGREFEDWEFIFQYLDRLMERDGDLIFIIQGGSTGADNIARYWAGLKGCPCAQVDANWEQYGKAAGPKRNRWMLELKPDLVVAFNGGAGTKNMINQANEAGFNVVKVGW